MRKFRLFKTIVKVSLRSLVANKLRSFLAMLGIIIGVSAVISMLALAAGARQEMMQKISAMGTNLLIVRPGQKGSKGVVLDSLQDLTLEDAQAILNKVSSVDQVTPIVRGRSQLKYYNANMRSRVMGTAATYFSIRNLEVAGGRIFTEKEVKAKDKVAVLGSEVVESLFGQSEPIGATIKVRGQNFLVVGHLKSQGDKGWGRPDKRIIIPYTTAMKRLLGKDKLYEIQVKAKEDADLLETQEDIAFLLRKRHEIEAQEPDDFEIRNQADTIEVAMETSSLFAILLGSIASISLFVGGIGIMNIMLVTVTERTKEIGIRKAIGAQKVHILQQFLLEAIFMSSLGGLVGVLAGVGVSRLISELFEFPTVVEFYSVALSLGFSVGVGIFFGYYPARRAASLNPIDALRYE